MSDRLHVLAGTAPVRTRLHRRDVRPGILALLERLPQTAAFVMSAAFEVLAWNDLAAALIGAAEFRVSVVMGLRSTLARCPTDPSVTGLVDELRDGSPDFARLRERHDVQAAPMLTKTFRHPVVGEITVDCDSLALTDRDQHLVLYSAPPGSSGAEALALLNVLGAESADYQR